MLPGGPGERHREVHDLATATAGDRGGDRALGGRVLVAENDPADPVGDRVAHPSGPDRVEWVHGGDQPEACAGPDHAEPGHRDLALGEHRDQDVEGLLGDPVELLQVQEGAGPHRPQQRSVGKAGRHVSLVKHLRGVVLADQPGGRELGVALGEDDGLAGLGHLADEPLAQARATPEDGFNLGPVGRDGGQGLAVGLEQENGAGVGVK